MSKICLIVHSDSTYVARMARMSLDKRANIKQATPISRLPSKPKILMILSSLAGKRDAVN